MGLLARDTNNIGTWGTFLSEVFVGYEANVLTLDVDYDEPFLTSVLVTDTGIVSTELIDV